MNLTDYPTPRTEVKVWNDWSHDALQFARQLEREAAAWRAVAEGLYDSDEMSWPDARKAFDALKSQLTQP